jgi:hypothetical protein
MGEHAFHDRRKSVTDQVGKAAYVSLLDDLALLPQCQAARRPSAAGREVHRRLRMKCLIASCNA